MVIVKGSFARDGGFWPIPGAKWDRRNASASVRARSWGLMAISSDGRNEAGGVFCTPCAISLFADQPRDLPPPVRSIGLPGCAFSFQGCAGLHSSATLDGGT